MPNTNELIIKEHLDFQVAKFLRSKSLKRFNKRRQRELIEVDFYSYNDVLDVYDRLKDNTQTREDVVLLRKRALDIVLEKLQLK